MRSDDIDPVRLYCTTEAARLLPSSRAGKRVNIRTLYRWQASGELRMVRVGQHWFVRGSEILRLLHRDDPRPMPTFRTEAQRREVSARILETFRGKPGRKKQ